MAEDYSSLSYEELVAEIQREEEYVADLRKTLLDVEDTIDSIEEQIEDEELSQVRARERFLRRRRTIARLQKGIVGRVEDIKRREERISELEQDIVRLQIFRAAPYTIRAVRRIISALRGWQTRRRNQQERDERRLKRLEDLQEEEAEDNKRREERISELEQDIVRLQIFRAAPQTISAVRRTISALRGWQTRRNLLERLKGLRDDLAYWRGQDQEIRLSIAREEARLERKRALLPKLYRVKIRLYNEMEGPNGSPTGMFQAWFDVDAILDLSTRLVRWDWWLTVIEVRIAKTHMVGYFKGMAKWAVPEDMGQATLDETLGIPYGEDRVKYARKMNGETFTKRLPAEYIANAEQMTVEELVVGESSVEPKPNPHPTAENMGVFFEKVMIIGPDGTIKWQEIRDRWVWHPTDDQVNKVKEELRIV